MGAKSRGNYTVGICLKIDCVNQGEKEICDKCYKFSNYEPIGEDASTDE